VISNKYKSDPYIFVFVNMIYCVKTLAKPENRSCKIDPIFFGLFCMFIFCADSIKLEYCNWLQKHITKI